MIKKILDFFANESRNGGQVSSRKLRTRHLCSKEIIAEKKKNNLFLSHITLLATM